ncbi:MAG: dihydrolipoyl dehydrogenase [Omnitrophica WOR_2 bacterium RIFOXYA2_FULL_38_17]|nr:MAG: dihydrolipoyl dehydrogenase [Omnitrophica WOR_2 bacterium RIFOXYA2_FULL_38_17]
MGKKILIIGAGPGGYTAAFLAADLGMDVTLIDKEINPGGTCLYRGCIPYKSLLHCAKILNNSKDAKDIGISFDKPDININRINEWKDRVIERLTTGLGQLVKVRKINYIQGTASFVNSNSAEIISKDNSKRTIKFENAIIATGSSPITIDSFPLSEKILNSADSVDLKNIPESVLIIGGGVIGLEAATIYSSLGSETSVVEMMPNILPGIDRDLSNILYTKLESSLKNVFLNTQITKIAENHQGLTVSFKDKKENTWTEHYTNVLLSIGRKPNTDNLCLDKANVLINEKGLIKTNDQKQTSASNIYAVGDVTGQPMLAHKASHEGKIAVENISGTFSKVSSKIPSVVYTDPEIATCGISEAQAKEENKNVTVVKFPWAASGRAQTTHKSDGVTKLIIDKGTQIILGAGIVGEHAGELIAECALAIEKELTVSDLKSVVHPHPTLSETIMEASEIFFGQATHIFRPRK